MKETQRPVVWAKIVQIYQPPLKEGNVHIIYDLDSSRIAQSLQLENEMNAVIQRVEEQAGTFRKDVLGDSVKKERLTQALKNDEGWRVCFKNICSFFSPDLDPTEAAKDIDRPFWSNLQFGFVSDIYEPPNYSINSQVSHSFLTQLAESTRSKYRMSRLKPVSVVSDLITADNRLVLGHRGGNNHSDVIMNVPAGSVEPHLKSEERGALFGSSDKENYEELALTPEHCSSSELIARVEEKLLVPEGWHYYVFRTRVHMKLDELLEHWQRAVDKKEHRHLVFYDAKDPDLILSAIKYNTWDINKAGEKINQTTPGNMGTFLPQCSANVLAHFVQQEGKQWAQQAQTYLDNHYDLTSCFNKE